MNEAPQDKIKVLLVEDDALPVAVIKRGVAKEFSNIEVVVAGNRADAAQKLKNDTFPVILMDNLFPVDKDKSPSTDKESPGIGLIRAVRAGEMGSANRQAKILFETGTLAPEVESAARSAGADVCIEKKDHTKFVPEIIAFIEQHLPGAKRGAAPVVGGGPG